MRFGKWHCDVCCGKAILCLDTATRGVGKLPTISWLQALRCLLGEATFNGRARVPHGLLVERRRAHISGGPLLRRRRDRMQQTRVLIIGEAPQRVDFSDPAIPPGMSADKVREGLEGSLKRLRDRGREADLVLTTSEDAAAGEVSAALAAKPYDIIVVGAGLRVVPKMTGTFEAVMNAIREAAPGARLAFNLSPDDSDRAAERQADLRSQR